MMWAMRRISALFIWIPVFTGMTDTEERLERQNGKHNDGGAGQDELKWELQKQKHVE